MARRFCIEGMVFAVTETGFGNDVRLCEILGDIRVLLVDMTENSGGFVRNARSRTRRRLEDT